MKQLPSLYVGTAGWHVPKTLASISGEGSHLERYARLFNGVEVNTTFYRPHLPKTFERWASAVPPDFRFAVKMHRSITHEHRLSDIGRAQLFLEHVQALGPKLGPVLIQLPPSLAWSAVASDFLSALREIFEGAVVLEARHPSWASVEAQRTLRSNAISGVAADPPLVSESLRPTGHPDPVYYRLHGSPRMYWSSYPDAFLDNVAEQAAALIRAGRSVWVIFDNTASDAAGTNAISLRDRVNRLLGEPVMPG